MTHKFSPYLQLFDFEKLGALYRVFFHVGCVESVPKKAVSRYRAHKPRTRTRTGISSNY